MAPDIGATSGGDSTSPPAGRRERSPAKAWAAGKSESPRQVLGYDCIDGHRTRGLDTADVMGAVFFGVHDDDDGRGTSGVLAEILEGNGRVAFSTRPNAAGHIFASDSALPNGYRARISHQGRT